MITLTSEQIDALSRQLEVYNKLKSDFGFPRDGYFQISGTQDGIYVAVHDNNLFGVQKTLYIDAEGFTLDSAGNRV